MLELGLAFELRRRNPHVVAHLPEKLDSYLRFPAPRLGSEIGNNDGVPSGHMIENYTEVCRIHLVLQGRRLRSGQNEHQRFASKITVQLQELDASPFEIRAPP